MTKQTVNIGSNANDGSGDNLRTAFRKINDNFAELYGDDSSADTFTSPQITTPTITGTTTIDHLIFNDNYISTATNANLELNPGGTGTVELQANTNVTGTLAVSGAATLSTSLNTPSLTLAAGATITEFATSTALGTSNTKVPTQNAVKTYIDNQIINSTAITFLGDDSTGTAVASGQSFQILGGTGLTSNVTGNVLTINVDGAILTTTDVQTLSNKTLTSPIISGHATIEGVTPTGATGTGNLVFSASPTVTGTLAAATITASGTLAVTSNATISGTLNTANITTTGSQSVSGNITAQGTVYSDRIQSPASNANLSISAQGTGIIDVQSAMTTVAQTITGTASVTGQFNADNLRIDGNTISSTDANGNIIITPNGGGQITLSSSRVAAYQLNAVTVAVSNTVDANTLRSYSTNADITIQPQGTGKIIVTSDLDIAGSTIINGTTTFNSYSVEKINTLTSASTISVNAILAPVHKVTLNINTTFSITNLPTGGSLTIIIVQDGTGSRTASFNSVKFSGGTPTLSTYAGAIDIVTIFNDGTNYYGNIAKAFA